MCERKMLGPERMDVAARLGGVETREPGTARRSEFDIAVRTAHHAAAASPSIASGSTPAGRRFLCVGLAVASWASARSVAWADSLRFARLIAGLRLRPNT